MMIKRKEFHSLRLITRARVITIKVALTMITLSCSLLLSGCSKNNNNNSSSKDVNNKKSDNSIETLLNEEEVIQEEVIQEEVIQEEEPTPTVKEEVTEEEPTPTEIVPEITPTETVPVIATEVSSPEITEVPVITEVPTIEITPTPEVIPTEKPTPTVEPTPTPTPKSTVKPTPKPTPTAKPIDKVVVPTLSGETINIGGVEVPVLKEFVPANVDTDGGFSVDTMEDSPYYDAAKEFDKYIHKEVTENIGKPVADDGATVMYMDDYLSISPYANHTQRQSMALNRNRDENQYELSLKVALYKEDEEGIENEYYELSNNCLKLLIAAFTDDIDTVYEAIYSAWETDENIYGINKEDFVPVGDSCQIKYDDEFNNFIIKPL